MLLWPFNKYPGTDYETFNWEWVLRTVKDYTAKVDDFIENITETWVGFKDWVTGQINQMHDDFAEYVNVTEGALNTGAIANGSITKSKISLEFLPEIENVYVTPEMFGAVGDGVVDDTAAWQAAVDVGVPVLATNALYKCGKINVTKNITIDCNNASFLCTDETLFYCYGSETQTLAGVNYSRDQQNYSVGDASYNGTVFIEGTNNFMPTRTYYKGGFMCTCTNGIIEQKYPIDVTGVTIHFVKPVSVNIKNLNSIDHLSGGTTFSVRIKYGLNCCLDNINGNYASYTVICLEKCLNCVVRHSNIYNTLGSAGTNSYVVAFNDSSFCKVENAILSNTYWHCCTTGGEYLAYRNTVIDSSLFSKTSPAYCDHDNGLYTTLANITCAGVYINGSGRIRDCIITPLELTSASFISLMACPLYNCADYMVENVEFITGSAFNGSNGINMQAFAEEVTGISKYVKNCVIKNCKNRGDTEIAIQINSATSEQLILQDVTIENTPFFRGYLGATQTNINIDDYNLTLKDVTNPNNSYSQGPAANFGKVTLLNCNFDSIRGNHDAIYFDDLTLNKQITNTMATVTKEMIGGTVHGYLRDVFLATIPLVSISQMTINSNYTANNINNASDGNKYYWWYGPGGTLTVVQVQA